VGDAFDAIVTGAAAKGTFVRISTPLLEGGVVRGVERLDVGDAVRFKLCRSMQKKASITSSALESGLRFSYTAMQREPP